MKTLTSLKQRLRKGETVIGTWCILPSSMVSHVLGACGLDFLIIDTEHGPMNFETSFDMINAVKVNGCTPLLRVAKNDEALILHALDIGAAGVVIPHIESKNAAASAVSFAKYHPLGERGFSPFTPAGKYSLHTVKTHCRTQNDETLVVLMLEGSDSISQLDKILSLKNLREAVDVIYIGAYDLSQAIGFPGEVDHPKVREALKKCVKKINAAKIAAGGYVAKNASDMEWMCAMGMQFITVLPDCTVLFHAFEKMVSDFKNVTQTKKARK